MSNSQTVFKFDTGTEGQVLTSYTSEGFDGGNANYPTRKASAAQQGAFGLAVPASSLDYVMYKNLSAETDVELIAYIRLKGTIPADLQFGVQLRYDSTNIAARNHWTSATTRNPRLIGAASATLWTGTSFDGQGMATADAYYLRLGLYAKAGATAAQGSVRLAGFSNQNSSPLTNFDSGILANQNLGGTSFAQARFGKLNTGTLPAECWMDTFVIRTGTYADGKLAPYVDNIAPSLSLAADKSVIYPGQVSTITASASDSDGTIASLAWSVISGSASLVGSGSTCTITAPPLSVDQIVTVQVIATDNLGATNTRTINITTKASMSRMFNGTSWAPTVKKLISS